MMYGVYDNSARVHWPPSKIFQDEILVSLHLIRLLLKPFLRPVICFLSFNSLDHRLVRANLLFPSCSCISRFGKD